MSDLRQRATSILDSQERSAFRRIKKKLTEVAEKQIRAVEFTRNKSRSEYVESVSIRFSSGVNVDDHCDIVLAGHHVCADYERMVVTVAYGKMPQFNGRYFITSWEYSYSDGSPVTRIKGGTLLFILNNWPASSKTYKKGKNYEDILNNILDRSGIPAVLKFHSYDDNVTDEKSLKKFGVRKKDVNLSKDMEHKVTETYAQFISKLARSTGDPDGFLFYVTANEEVYFEKELTTDWASKLDLDPGPEGGLDQLTSYSIMSSRVGKVDSIKRIGNPTSTAISTADTTKEEDIKIYYSSETDVDTQAKANVTVKPRIQKIANSQRPASVSKGIKQKLTTARLEFDGIVYMPVNRVLLINAGFNDESPISGRFVVTSISMFADDSSLTTSITAKKESTVSSSLLAQTPDERGRRQTSGDKSSEKGSQSTYGTVPQ